MLFVTQLVNATNNITQTTQTLKVKLVVRNKTNLSQEGKKFPSKNNAKGSHDPKFGFPHRIDTTNQ